MTDVDIEKPHPDRVSDAYHTHCVVSGTMTLVALASVFLRFVDRLRARDVRSDDWFILGGLVFNLGVFVCNILISLPSLGAAGYHIETYTAAQLDVWAKIRLAAGVLYQPSVSLSQLSVLFFYRRIFAIDRHFQILMPILLFLVTGLLLGSIFGIIFSYSPVYAQWESGIPHTTIDTVAFYVSTSSMNVAIHSAMLLFAQLKVWNLHLDTRRKILLSLVFLVGIAAVAAGILRTIYLSRVDQSNLTYTTFLPGIWTNVEMSLCIICACLPLIYGLLRARVVVVVNSRRSQRRSHRSAPSSSEGDDLARTVAAFSSNSSSTGSGKNTAAAATATAASASDKWVLRPWCDGSAIELGLGGDGGGYTATCERVEVGGPGGRAAEEEAQSDLTPMQPVRVRLEYSVL